MFEQTAKHMRDLGLSLACLPPWYDVDDGDDWEVLALHIVGMREAGIDPHVPRTERLLVAGP